MSNTTRFTRYAVVLVVGTLLALGGAVSVANLDFDYSSNELQPVGPQHGINLLPIEDAPDWAQDAIYTQEFDYPHHVSSAVLDLNADGQPEILLAEGNPIIDVYIPKSTFKILQRVDSKWEMIETNQFCRPNALGSLRSDGYWDVRCESERGVEQMLRWDGNAYTEVDALPLLAQR